jgi:hypothetical protein
VCQEYQEAAYAPQTLAIEHVKQPEKLTTFSEPTHWCHFGSAYTRPHLIAIANLADQMKLAWSSILQDFHSTK